MIIYVFDDTVLAYYMVMACILSNKVILKWYNKAQQNISKKKMWDKIFWIQKQNKLPMEQDTKNPVLYSPNTFVSKVKKETK